MTGEKTLLTIAVLGGTGKEGSGLVLRWAAAGYHVIIGSRDAQRAVQKAEELNALLGAPTLTGAGNAEAAARADLVVLSVPYDAHRAILESVREAVQGKILIDVTVPIKGNPTTVYVPEGRAAALEAQALVGEDVRVVAAFQNVSASHLKKLNHPVDCDVLVCGDDAEAKAETIKLVESIGMRGLDAGPLENAVAVEALTPVLIGLGMRYKARGAGIRITGIGQP